MKHWITVAVVVSLIGAAFPSVAQQRDQGRRGAQSGSQARESPQRPPERRGGQNADRPQPQPQPARMTEDERRQLRRDISDHGRDIYRDRERQQRR